MLSSIANLNITPGVQISPYIQHTGIVPDNYKDAQSLVQLGEISGLMASIQTILTNNLKDAGDITKRYGKELWLKLQAISNYRWQSGNDPTGFPKILTPNPKNRLYISESPHSVLNKARQFVAMYNMPKSPYKDDWGKLSESQQEIYRNVYGTTGIDNLKTVEETAIAMPLPPIGDDMLGGTEYTMDMPGSKRVVDMGRMPLNGGKYHTVDMRNIW